MTTKEKLLAAKLLKEAADHYGDHSCNDYALPDSWSAGEVRTFVDEFYAWNGDQDAHDPKHQGYLNLPDFAVMDFLASKLECEVEALNASPMNPSDTPRNDSEAFIVHHLGYSLDVVRLEFSRQLERELNAQIEANKSLREGFLLLNSSACNTMNKTEP